MQTTRLPVIAIAQHAELKGRGFDRCQSILAIAQHRPPPERFVLDDSGQVVRVDAITWEQWFRDNIAPILCDTIDLAGEVCEVVSVFVGVDPDFSRRIEHPLLWQCVTFGGPMDMESCRFTSLEEAQVGHALFVGRSRDLLSS